MERITDWILVIFAVALLLLLTHPAEAEEEAYLAPVAIGAAAIVVARAPYFARRCNEQPCNALSHVALGAGVGWYVRREWGWRAALLSGVVIGVGKELADQNFDVKDALATIAGSVLAVAWEW